MVYLKAISSHCRQCSGGSKAEVTRCTVNRCPLYVHRTTYSDIMTMKEEKKKTLKVKTMKAMEEKRSSLEAQGCDLFPGSP